MAVKRPATQKSVKQQLVKDLPDLTDKEKAAGGRLLWVALDSEGRRFMDTSEAGAAKMLADYNHAKQTKFSCPTDRAAFNDWKNPLKYPEEED